MTRLEHVQSTLQEGEAIILVNPINVRYIAGFTGTTVMAFIMKACALVLVDSRYIEQATLECPSFEVLEYKGKVQEWLRDLLQERRIQFHTCYVEGPTLSLDRYETLDDAFPEVAFISQDFTPWRMVKDDEELALLRHAFSIADESFQALLPQLQPGMREIDAKIALEIEMLKRGSEGPSFATIVASGHRSSLPHGVASEKVLEEGDMITFDFGATYQGYHSDMTRTIVLGKATQAQKALYNTVLEAQKRGVAAVRAGVSTDVVDAVCRDYIGQAGYGAYFGHGTGHGVGLEIHELPNVSPSSKIVLEPNVVITIEPGIYLPNQMGVRIEDTVVVTEEGCEILTKTPKDLIELEV